MQSIDNIPKFSGTFNDLIDSIGNLRYDKLSEFYFSLSKYEKDESTSKILLSAHDEMKNIWDDCKKYDNSKHPTNVVGFDVQ